MQTETEQIPTSESSVARPKPVEALASDPAAASPTAPAPEPTAAQANPLANMLNPQPSAGYELATIERQQPPTVIDSRPLLPPAAAPGHKARRKGRIACLPKLHRDTVNRMLWNGVPYKNIVEALGVVGFGVTERNVSSWATGGYLDWRYEQDLVLDNRLGQDHLVDHLRREDASELPEVGLQAAATRLSQILLQKTARADDVEPNLPAFSQMVDILCRLNREIATLQKQRDDAHRTLGAAHDPARIKDADERDLIEAEREFGRPSADSAGPPLLPGTSTCDLLAEQDHAAEIERKLENSHSVLQMMQAFTGKKPAPASAPAPNPQPAASPPAPRSGTASAPQNQLPKSNVSVGCLPK